MSTDAKTVQPMTEEEWRLRILLCLQNIDISVEKLANRPLVLIQKVGDDEQ